jgi:type I pantothenate kinase
VTDAASRYINFGRDEWAELARATPLTLGRERSGVAARHQREHRTRRGRHDLPADDPSPESLRVGDPADCTRRRESSSARRHPKVPFIIGIAGSVAVGKSTFARILQALLARWPDHPKVDLVTTDGFLYPNKILDDRGLMNRKGFPESYDTRRLLRFLRELKSGMATVSAAGLQPRRLRHHRRRDDRREPARHRDPRRAQRRCRSVGPSEGATEFVSDYFDFSIYIDAAEEHIEEWYVQRFMKLRDTVFQNPDSFFRHFAALSTDEAVETAQFIWHDINGKNLRENIAPTKGRAALLLRKGRRPSRRGGLAPQDCDRQRELSQAGRSVRDASSAKCWSCSSTCSRSHRMG